LYNDLGFSATLFVREVERWIYTLPILEQQGITVERLSVLMANDGRNGQNSGVLEPKPQELPLASQQIQQDKW
jgi:hypothetical protein